MKLTAKLISILLHPVFMPLIGIFIIYNTGVYSTGLNWEVKKYTYLLGALFSIFMPVSILMLLLYFRQVQEIELSDKRERILPVLISAFSQFLLFVVIKRVLPLSIVQAYIFSIVVLSLLLFVSTFRLKLSMHMLGLGGLSGLLFILSNNYQIDVFYLFVLALLLSGLVASIRYYLKAHNFTEIISGYLLGFFGSIGFMLMYLRLNW